MRRFDLAHDDPGRARQAAAAALDAGRLVVVPTETVYGIAARSDRPEARGRLAALKGGRTQPWSLAVASFGMLEDELVSLTAAARRLTARWWPGPITLVCPARDGTSCGVRVPGHPWTRALIEAVGVPLLLPSANLAGARPPRSLEELDPAVAAEVDLAVDGGPTALGEASTVVELRPALWRIVREGVVSRADLARHAPPLVLLVCSGNTCRSPMAERLLRRELQARAGARTDLVLPEVRSAGISAAPGRPASDDAREALATREMDLSDHRSRAVTEALLREADLVLAMTAAHLAVVRELLPAAGPPATLFDPAGADVADPFGGGPEVYEECARQLERLAAQRAAEITG